MTPSPPPADLPARLMRRRVRVNGHGKTSSTLAAFKFCCALGPLRDSDFESIREASPEQISAFLKRRGPAKIRDLDEERARVAKGFWIDITVIERRSMSRAGEIISEFSFGDAACDAQALPFESPDAWGVASSVSQADLERQCSAILEAEALRLSTPSARASPSVPAPRI